MTLEQIDSEPTNGPATTARSRPKARHRRLRYVVYCVVIFLSIEAVAWVCDGVFGYHRRLLVTLNRLQVVNQPIEAQSEKSLLSPSRTVHIRSPEPVPLPERPYVLGGRVIPDARPSDSEALIRADELLSQPEKRIFVVGGSAAFGFPYSYEQTFASILEEPLLERGYRMINRSQVGATSGELVPAVHRIVADFAPQTLIIFVGNNEWIHWMPDQQPRLRKSSIRLLRTLSHSRALSAVNLGLLNLLHRRAGSSPRSTSFSSHQELSGSAYALAHPGDDPSFDPRVWLELKQRYLETFEANLRDMIRTAQDAGVRVIVCTVPFNYRLSPAWKHPQPESFDPQHQQQVRQNIQRAASLLGNGQSAEALGVLNAALDLDPLPPLLNYLKGECLEALDRPAKAETSYALCREHMLGNLGSRLSINDSIVKVAGSEGAEVIDVRGLFDDYEHRQGRYFNVDLVHDDCHPTPLGHQVIAEELLTHFDR